LTPDQIEAIAQRVAELVAPMVAAELRQAPVEPVSARKLAPLIGMSYDWIMENKQRLGGWPVGDGERPRWQFDVATAKAAMARRDHRPAKAAPRRRGRRPVSSAPNQTGGHRSNGPAPDTEGVSFDAR
jgi:hypothetical protein